MGIRSLESSDKNYQGVFGCGLQHPDQYHRDLCRHQGTAWPWLLGQYCDAVINVFGRSEEIVNRIKLTTQPMFDHFIDEDCCCFSLHLPLSNEFNERSLGFESDQ